MSSPLPTHLLSISISISIGICMLLASSHVRSQNNPSHLASGVDASDDSDGFREFKPWAQYEATNGWGLRASWQRYAIEGWSTTGRSLYLTHHIKQDGWTSKARLGLNRTGKQQHVLGMWEAMYQFTPATAAGWSLEKDVVNSKRSLEQGLTSSTALAVVDHQFHPSLSVGVSAGSTWFSDHNRRDMLRSRWTVTLDEERGLYTYLITRHYRNSAPYQGAYFAPARFREAAAGLMWKHLLFDHIILSAHADLGRQYVDGSGKHLWHWGLFLSSRHRATTQWTLGLSSSEDQASNLSDGSYRYTSFVAMVRIPY